MHKVRSLATVVATAAITVATAATAPITPAAAAGVTVHGCPSGAVCIYPRDKGWNGDHPSVEYFSYGTHNLSYQLGKHYVLNNQYIAHSTGWPEAALNTGYNGTGDNPVTLDPYDGRASASWVNTNLTPINSIMMWVL